MKSLLNRLYEFNVSRGWIEYHDAKSLILALVGEVGELAEVFCWHRSSRQVSKARKRTASFEIADIFIYLAALSRELGIDMEKAVTEKLGENAKRFPAKR